MQFWNLTDTILVKKIEHYGKKLTRKKVHDAIQWLGLKDKRDKILEYYEHHHSEINKTSLPPKNKLMKQKKLQNELKSEFITEHLIPILLKNWFFDSYKVPMKRDSLNREVWEHWMF